MNADRNSRRFSLSGRLRTCALFAVVWVLVSFASASLTSHQPPATNHQPPVTSHYGVTDDPRTFPPATRSFSSSPLLPDTLIQRLVNKVSPDSIQRQIQRLQDFRTRNSPTESCRAAERYVFDYFTALGLDSVSLDSYPGSGGTWRNVVGTIRGTLNPDAVLIICGHMDATSENANVLAPGAEDNASGTVMAIEAARVLADENLDFTVKFIAFTGEEQGLYGSSYYARLMRSRNVNLVGVLNFDMIAWPGGDWGTQITTDSASEPLARVEDEMAATYTNLAHRVNVRGPLGSDQLPFQQQGFPATAAIEYGHIGYPYYHNTGDTLGNLSMPLAAEVAKMGIATLVALTAIPAPTAGFSLVDAGTGGTLLAQWSANPDRDLAGYRLLWGTAPRTYSDSLTLGRVTSCPIAGLENGTRYCAALRAFDSLGHVGNVSAEDSAVPGDIPLAPAGVTAMPGLSAMRLTWRANAELDLAGYCVYRSTLSDTDYVRQNASPLTDTAWSDSGLLPDTMYYYVITALDTSSHESNRSSEVRGKPLSFDHGILLVDETRNGAGQPGNPSDEQVDAFYHNLLHGFRYTDWDVTQQGPPLAGDIGPYSSIVWHADDFQEQRIYAAVQGLANYLVGGGRLWLVGWKPVYALLNGASSYPMNLLPGQFPYDHLHLDRVKFAQTQDFIGALGDGGYPSVSVDSSKTMPSMHGRLPLVEMYVPRDAYVTMRYVSYSGDTLNQSQPVGIAFADRIALLGFPLYYTREDEARPLALRILQDFQEPYAIEEALPVPRVATSLAAHPNPFRGATRIHYSIARPGRVRITVHDVTGRQLGTLVNQYQTAGTRVIPWQDNDAPAGIMFVRLETGRESAVLRLVRTERN